jgi:phosphatidylserine synthase
MISKKRIWKWTEHAILFLLLSIFYCRGLQSIAFMPDESQWIATSLVYEDYIHGNFSSPAWDESYWTVTQPPLPRYWIGLGRGIGGFGVSDLNMPWVWQKDFPANVAEGRKPSEQLLWWSRFPMGVLAAFAIFIGFLILEKLQGRLLGYFGVLLCLLSSYFPIMLSRAMGEASLLAAIAGVLLVSDWLLRRSINQDKLEKSYFYFFLLGIIIGFAQSSKLNGLFAIGAGFAFALIVAFRVRQDGTKKGRFAVPFLILIFSTLITFILLNPFLWKDPIGRTLIMYHNRVVEMRGQQLDYSDTKIEGFNERINIITSRIFQDYAAFHFEGALWINILFFLIGFSYLVVKTFQYLQGADLNPTASVIFLVGGATSLPSLFTPLDWDRYYLLPVYFSTLIIAMGIWLSGVFMYRLLSKQTSFQKKIRNYPFP